MTFNTNKQLLRRTSKSRPLPAAHSDGRLVTYSRTKDTNYLLYGAWKNEGLHVLQILSRSKKDVLHQPRLAIYSEQQDFFFSLLFISANDWCFFMPLHGHGIHHHFTEEISILL